MFQVFKNECKVTVPLHNELYEKPFSANDCGKPFYASDYSVAMGTHCYMYFNNINGEQKKAGSVWLREAQDERGFLTVGVDGHRNWAVVGARHTGVAPRFQNPEKSGIATDEVNGKTVLTINGKVALYPQTRVSDRMIEELDDALNSGGLIQNGEFISDQESNESTNSPFKKQVNKTYNYNGKTYCFVEKTKSYNMYSKFREGGNCENWKSYWFLCEPIEVEKCKDGAIQCKEILSTCQFEVDGVDIKNLLNDDELNTDDFAIGNFLNDHFLQDLIRSTELLNEQTVEKKKAITFNFQRDILGRV